jgi:hypothetical protein
VIDRLYLHVSFKIWKRPFVPREVRVEKAPNATFAAVYDRFRSGAPDILSASGSLGPFPQKDSELPIALIFALSPSKASFLCYHASIVFSRVMGNRLTRSAMPLSCSRENSPPMHFAADAFGLKDASNDCWMTVWRSALGQRLATDATPLLVRAALHARLLEGIFKELLEAVRAFKHQNFSAVKVSDDLQKPFNPMNEILRKATGTADEKLAE